MKHIQTYKIFEKFGINDDVDNMTNNIIQYINNIIEYLDTDSDIEIIYNSDSNNTTIYVADDVLFGENGIKYKNIDFVGEFNKMSNNLEFKIKLGNDKRKKGYINFFKRYDKYFFTFFINKKYVNDFEIISHELKHIYDDYMFTKNKKIDQNLNINVYSKATSVLSRKILDDMYKIDMNNLDKSMKSNAALILYYCYFLSNSEISARTQEFYSKIKNNIDINKDDIYRISRMCDIKLNDWKKVINYNKIELKKELQELISDSDEEDVIDFFNNDNILDKIEKYLTTQTKKYQYKIDRIYTYMKQKN